MTKFLAGVLSVIAVGVLLIAYGLLSPRRLHSMCVQRWTSLGVRSFPARE